MRPFGTIRLVVEIAGMDRRMVTGEENVGVVVNPPAVLAADRVALHRQIVVMHVISGTTLVMSPAAKTTRNVLLLVMAAWLTNYDVCTTTHVVGRGHHDQERKGIVVGSEMQLSGISNES